MGRPDPGAGRGPRRHHHRHHRAPGSPPHPGAPASSQGARRRYRRLYRGRTGDRLAADDCSQSGNPRSKRQPGDFEAASSSRGSKCRRGSIEPKATFMPPAIRISKPTRAASSRSPSRWRLVSQNWIRQMPPPNCRAVPMIRCAVERGARRWAQEAAPLKGTPIAVQHAGWVYLVNWLGLNQVAVLEPSPAFRRRAAISQRCWQHSSSSRSRW